MEDMHKEVGGIHEISLLATFLEAEIEGRPFDRKAAKRLATELGQRYHSMRESMEMVANRFQA